LLSGIGCCVSQFSLSLTKYLGNYLKGGKIIFLGLWFQRLQTTVLWHHGFKILVRKCYGEKGMVESSCSECGSKKAERARRRGKKQDIRLQGCVPNGLLLPVGPTY
jgi:hypothetical protein